MEYLQKLLFDFKMKKITMLNMVREFIQDKSGDLVYIISPLTSQLRASSRKVSVRYAGPVGIQKIIGPKSFLLYTSDKKLLLGFCSMRD